MEELLRELLAVEETTKGGRGRVGIVGGCVGHAAPPALAAQAAIRTGTDVAKVVTSERVLTAVAGFSENIVVERYLGDYLSESGVSQVEMLAEWSDVLLVGPGLSKPKPRAVNMILDRVSIPTVVDADAILPVLGEGPFPGTVFTPDANEVDMITTEYDSLENFAERTGAVVVSTGETDEIYGGSEPWTNETGTPAMTIAGTGDIHAGMVASLMGQGLDRVDAARLGTWLIGRAGERATDEYSIGLTANDVVNCIPEVLVEHRDSRAADPR
jgi:hydroxyethylthiazole kinase-like uncharacterized protein yjeF